MRRKRFEVDGIRFNGSTKAVVTIETSPASGLQWMRVHAFRQQREVSMLLSDVVQILLERDAKQLAADRAAASKARVR